MLAAVTHPSVASTRSAVQPFSTATQLKPLCRCTRSRTRTVVKAYIDPAVSFAVSQQAAAFAVVLAAEGAYTRSRLPESDKGRPSIQIIGGGVGAIAFSLLLVLSGKDFLENIGFVAGFLASGAMMVYNVQRFTNTETDDGDWPGNKAWPATMTLISFFALNVFLQALRSEL